MNTIKKLKYYKTSEYFDVWAEFWFIQQFVSNKKTAHFRRPMGS